jgi:hypothetical protein
MGGPWTLYFVFVCVGVRACVEKFVATYASYEKICPEMQK